MNLDSKQVTTGRRRLGSLAVSAGLILAIAATVYLIFITRPQVEPLHNSEKIWRVDAQRIQHRSIQPELRLMGMVVAQRASEIRALVNGVVTEVGENLKPGGEVSKGELLVAVDVFEYRTTLQEQEAGLRESLAREKFLLSRHRRLSELAEHNLVSPAAIDESVADVAGQRAAVEQHRLRIRRIRRDIRNSRLASPFQGLVESPSAQIGKRLSVGDPIATLIDQASLEVRFSLSKTQFGSLLADEAPFIGRRVQIDWRLGDELVSYPATIDRLGSKINSHINGVDVFAVIDKPMRKSRLRSGALVQVRLPGRRYAGVFAIPEQALLGADKVRIIRDHRVYSTSIEVVGSYQSMLLARGFSGGPVADGTVVVTTASQEILDGAQVTVVKLTHDGQDLARDKEPGGKLAFQQVH